MFLSDSLKADAAEAARVLSDIDAVRERFEKGEKLSDTEDYFVKRLLARERAEIETSDAIYRKDRETYEKRAAAAESYEDQRKLFIDFVEQSGKGRFTDEELRWYRELTAELEAASKAAKELEDRTTRITETTGKDARKAKDQINEKRLGTFAQTGTNVADYYDAVGNGLNEADRAKLQQYLDQAKPEDIRDGVKPEDIGPGVNLDDWAAAIEAANKLLAAQEELKDLTDAEAAAKKREDAHQRGLQTLLDLEAELSYRQKIVQVGEEGAKLWKLQVYGGLSRKEADRQLDRERQIRVLDNEAKLKADAEGVKRDANPLSGFVDEMARLQLLLDRGLIGQDVFDSQRGRLVSENVRTEQATAAPVIQKGSQEAFKALTGQSVDKINQQISEAKKQTLLQGQGNAILQRVKELLDELNDNKPQRLGS